MDKMNIVWIGMLLHVGIMTVADPKSPVAELENLAGRLIFYQMEGNATFLRDKNELASDVPTKTVFEFSNPKISISSANFSFTWDLGNGKVICGKDPAVCYKYPNSGNYTLQLKVGANMTNSSTLVSDVYSADVQVLDPIKNITLNGQSDYEMSRNVSLEFDMDGSPPISVCWHFLQNCLPDPNAGCSLTMVYQKKMQLSHTFTTSGYHCLDMSVRNDVSQLQTSFSLYIKKNSSIHMLFILPCTVVLVATFSFIAIAACLPRRRNQNKSQMVAFSNAVFLGNEETAGENRVLLDISAVDRGEKAPLISQFGQQYSS